MVMWTGDSSKAGETFANIEMIVQLWTGLLPAIYMISSVISSPIVGIFSDRATLRRPLFLWGLVFQAGGIGLLMKGTSLAFWISGLIIIGISNGIVWTSSLALAVDAVEQSKLAESLGFINISLTVGLFLGPVIGGVVYDRAGYHAVWGVCFGIVGVDAILRLILIEPRQSRAAPTPTEPESDIEESAGAVNANSVAKESLKAGKKSPWTRSPTLLLWKSPRFCAMMLVTVLDATMLTSFDGSLAIHLHDTFNYTSLGVGLTYIAMIIPTFFATLVGRFADRHGSRALLTTTQVIGIVPLVCLRFVDHNTLNQKVLLCALLALIGACAAGRLGIYSAQVDHAVSEHAGARPDLLSHEKAIAQAQGIWAASYSTGCAVGPIWGGLIQGAAGWKTETWTLTLLSGSAAVVVFLFADGPLWRARKSEKDLMGS
ncbi:hypothetical protein Q7P37_005522 [Cladosporium fusiforme]